MDWPSSCHASSVYTMALQHLAGHTHILETMITCNPWGYFISLVCILKQSKTVSDLITVWTTNRQRIISLITIDMPLAIWTSHIVFSLTNASTPSKCCFNWIQLTHQLLNFPSLHPFSAIFGFCKKWPRGAWGLFWRNRCAVHLTTRCVKYENKTKFFVNIAYVVGIWQEKIAMRILDVKLSK